MSIDTRLFNIPAVASKYLQAISTDIQGLTGKSRVDNGHGVLVDAHEGDQFQKLKTALSLTQFLFNGLSNINSGYIPETSLGERIAQTSVVENDLDVSGFDICPAAEASFCRSIYTAVVHEYAVQPVIVIKNDTPVAVVKADSVPSAYCLVDDQESGLVAGTIAGYAAPFRVKQFTKSDQAWTIPLDSFEKFKPRRFARFCVDASSRTTLFEGLDPVAKVDHTTIVRQIAQLASEARPVK